MARCALIFAALASGGCNEEDGGRGSTNAANVGKGDCVGEACEATGPIDKALCSVDVADASEDGKTIEDIDIDPDYVAKVLQCDFDKLGPAGLRAAAIAVRSTAYWQMATTGEVCSSDLLYCPDYTCEGTPTEKFRDAAYETRGQYLSYGDTVTYGFYIDGEELDKKAESCVHPDDDPRVTYNDGKSGDDVGQSLLGKLSEPADSTYGQNRGAMSIEAMACLEADGKAAPQILRFFYGEDIEVAQAPVDRDCVADDKFDARFSFVAEKATDETIEWSQYAVQVTTGDEEEDGEPAALETKSGKGEAGIDDLEPGTSYEVWMRHTSQDDWQQCTGTLKGDQAREVVQTNVEVSLNDDHGVGACSIEQSDRDEFAMVLLIETDTAGIDWTGYDAAVSTSSTSVSGNGVTISGRRTNKKAFATITDLPAGDEHYVYLRRGTTDWVRCECEVDKADDTEIKVGTSVEFEIGGVIDSCSIEVGDDDAFDLELTVLSSANSVDTKSSDIEWKDLQVAAGTTSKSDGLTGKAISDAGTTGLVELKDLDQNTNYYVWMREGTQWTRCLNRVDSPDDKLQAKLYARFDNGGLEECSVGRDDTEASHSPTPDPEPDPEPTPDPEPDPADGGDDHDGGTTGGGDMDTGDTGDSDDGDVFDEGESDAGADPDDGDYPDDGDDGDYPDNDSGWDDRGDDGDPFEPGGADEDNDPFGGDESGTGETEGGSANGGGGGCNIANAPAPPTALMLLLLFGWGARRRD